jgi:drug/metabolite transporter (DMT)-like permease
MAGVAFLFVQEMRQSEAGPRDVLIGIGLTVGGVLSASVANVMQASERMRVRPIVVTVAWGMFYGVLFDAAAAFILFGPPVFESRAGYWAGLVYLGLFASALAFTLYFGIVRAIGPARAAYSSLIVPVVAMTLSTAFEDYRWSTLAVAGGLLALLGLIVALRARPPAVAAPPEA